MEPWRKLRRAPRCSVVTRISHEGILSLCCTCPCVCVQLSSVVSPVFPPCTSAAPVQSFTMSASENQTVSKASETIFPDVPSATATVMKKAFRVFKKAFSLSSVSLLEAQGEEPSEEGPSGAEVYFDDSNCDERLRGLSHEQALTKSKSLFLEDTAEAIKRSLRETISMGEVEMLEIMGDTGSDSEIMEYKAGSSSGASSSGASSSGASTSYGIV